MSSCTRRLAFLVVLLASTGHGWRLQRIAQRMQKSALAENQRLEWFVDANVHSNVSSKSAWHPWNSLATMLMTPKQAIAFKQPCKGAYVLKIHSSALDTLHCMLKMSDTVHGSATTLDSAIAHDNARLLNGAKLPNAASNINGAMAQDAATPINSFEEAGPDTLELKLRVQDREVVQALSAIDDSQQREQFALQALRIGVLAMQQAEGQLDTAAMRREGDQLISELRARLEQHEEMVQSRVEGLLKVYFDPNSGQFNERVERLIRKDGDLESTLRRQIGSEDSELSRTLSQHLGATSPLLRYLHPEQSDGLMAQLRNAVDQQLTAQRELILRQFSLNEESSALSTFLRELTSKQDLASGNLQAQIQQVVKEFSLDEESSALSRLVRNVERAQGTITREFSLDDKDSSLSRLRQELSDTLAKQEKVNQEFQQEVRTILNDMATRKDAVKGSPRAGLSFEKDMVDLLQQLCQAHGDVVTPTGLTTGYLRHCKVGDAVLCLGPESSSAGARIVVEAKEEASYTLERALNELQTARDNRDAQVGIFVWSRRLAPDNLEPVSRYGNDIIIAWDSEDPDTDLFIKVGLSLARALCVRQAAAAATLSDSTKEIREIDRGLSELERQLSALDQIETWANTIRSSSEKILDKTRNTRRRLEAETDALKDATESLRRVLIDKRADTAHES